MQLISQIEDIGMLGLIGYFTNFSSMFQLSIIVIHALFVYYSFTVVINYFQQEVTDKFIETLRCIEIAVITILNF